MGSKPLVLQERLVGPPERVACRHDDPRSVFGAGVQQQCPASQLPGPLVLCGGQVSYRCACQRRNEQAFKLAALRSCPGRAWLVLEESTPVQDDRALEGLGRGGEVSQLSQPQRGSDLGPKPIDVDDLRRRFLATIAVAAPEGWG